MRAWKDACAKGCGRRVFRGRRAFAENESDRRIRRINHENQYNPAFYRCSGCGRDADRLCGARGAERNERNLDTVPTVSSRHIVCTGAGDDVHGRARVYRTAVQLGPRRFAVRQLCRDMGARRRIAGWRDGRCGGGAWDGARRRRSLARQRQRAESGGNHCGRPGFPDPLSRYCRAGRHARRADLRGHPARLLPCGRCLRLPCDAGAVLPDDRPRGSV